MSSLFAVKVRKPGCAPCRERHMRCDGARPVCSSCRKARHSLRCEYRPPPLKLRPSFYSSEATSNSRSIRSCEKENSSIAPPATPSSEDGSMLDIHSSETLLSVDEQDQLSDGRRQSPSLSLDTSRRSSNQQPPDIVSRRVVSDSLDAKVFDFFIKHAGPWLDIVSPSRYFGETVPILALRDLALYYACLACSARVLTLRGELDKARGDFYEDRAIAELIPRLSQLQLQRAETSFPPLSGPNPLLTESAHGEPPLSETLPATTVILRMAEQFSEIQDDARCHLVGASSIFASGGDPNSASLGAAAFWVYMRQSIRISFLNEEPCRFDFDSSSGRLVLVDHDETAVSAPTSDAGWANRMTYLLARSCTACWDGTLDGGARARLLDELRALVELWRESLPDTFQAWCDYRAENDLFPVIRFISPWHVIGWQYYYAAKVLLGVYRKPPEMNMIELSRHMESEVMAPTRLLCAITFACEHVGASINGTHLVAWCGQLLPGRAEQQILLGFLHDFMVRTKWPNQTCCDRLTRLWSGQSRSWLAASSP